MAKLSISIPDELKELLDDRADKEHVPVSHVVSEALRQYFALPVDDQVPKAGSPSPTPADLAEQLRQVQEYLCDLHFSYERTRSAAYALYYWAERNGEVLGIPPEDQFKKPPWPKPRPKTKS